MKNIIKSFLIGVTIVTSLAMTAVPAFADTVDGHGLGANFGNTTPSSLPDGVVIFGDGNAYDLSYANNPVNLAVISKEVVANHVIWIKGFSGTFIDNNTGLTVPSSDITAQLTYTSTQPIVTQ